MRRRSRQSGAVAVLAAIAAGAGLVALALAIDVGRLYAAQRDLQRVANLAALDAARVSGGCMGLPDDPSAAAFGEALGSIQRNGGGRDEVRPLRVELGREFKAADGKRYFDTAPDRTNHAVRVTLTRPAPARLLPLTPATGELTAVAAARSRPYASVHIGSRLVQLNPEGLNRFFGAAFRSEGPSVSAVGYTSLFEASVPLDSIIGVLDPGTPDRIRLRPLSVAQLLSQIADTLAAAGNDAAAEAARQIMYASEATEWLTPPELIAVEREVAQILGSALIGAGDLTVLAAQATSDSAAIELLYSMPPPLGDSTALIRFIEPGQVAELTPGAEGSDEPQYASNTQALIETSLTAPVPLLGGDLELPLWLQVAQATARVTDIHCARLGEPRDVVTVDARSSVSRIGIGSFDDIRAPVPQPQRATLLELDLPAGRLGIPVPVHVRAVGFSTVDIPSAREELVFTSPFPSRPQEIGGPRALALLEAVSQLPSGLDLDVEITPLGPGGERLADITETSLRTAVRNARGRVQSALETAIAEALTAGGDRLLGRVLDDAGLTLGGADVSVYSVTAKEPYLFLR
jgi:uncharacterized membrane protein